MQPYKDKKGNTLLGFSQVDLDKLAKHQRNSNIIHIIWMLLVIGFFIYLSTQETIAHVIHTLVTSLRQIQ